MDAFWEQDLKPWDIAAAALILEEAGGTVTTLHSFGGAPLDGAFPFAGLIQGRDGNFYGTTQQGGAGDIGTIYKMTPAGVVTVPGSDHSARPTRISASP